MIKEIEAKIAEIDKQLAAAGDSDAGLIIKDQLIRNRAELLSACAVLPAEDKVYLARHPQRPNIKQYIDALFDDFFELRGDRLCSEDASILGGIAFYRSTPVTVIGHLKGRNLEENMRCNFGMPSPDGYRKALRLMKQAEKFNRPIITFIDTPGAYPGLEAEARGQAEAIARNLAEMSTLSVPVISIVTGEGSSGGALAIGVANTVLMLENAIYSILSPEGFASILWKDSSKSGEAAQVMKLTAEDLLSLGVIDGIIPEPLGGAHRDLTAVFAAVDAKLDAELTKLKRMSTSLVVSSRYNKFRMIGTPDPNNR